MHISYNCSYTQCYFTVIRNKKWCFKAKNCTDRNSNYFPYFLNMQEIFCLEWDGHARHWNIIFMGCTVVDICPHRKCNGLCLRGERVRQVRKQRSLSSPPAPKSKCTLSNCYNGFFQLGPSSQNSLLVLTQHMKSSSAQRHTHSELKRACSLSLWEHYK